MNPIMNYAVAEVATVDAWGGMITATIALPLRNEQGFLAACTTWEEGYKADTSNSIMPAAYRSAKSVLKNAIKAGIPLVDGNGVPLPKSQLDKAIAEAKSDKSPEEKASIMAGTLVKYCVKHGLHVEDYINAAIDAAQA